MASDDDEGVNLAAVMPFDSTRAALRELPTVMPRMPQIPMGDGFEASTNGVPSKEVLGVMANALREVIQQKGFGLGVDEGTQTASAEGDLYRALFQKYPGLVVGEVEQPLGVSTPMVVTDEATQPERESLGESGHVTQRRLSMASVTPSDVSIRREALEVLQKAECDGDADTFDAFRELLTEICLQVDQASDPAVDQDTTICKVLTGKQVENIRDSVKFHSVLGSLPKIDMHILQSISTFLDARARVTLRELEALVTKSKSPWIVKQRVHHISTGMDAINVAMSIITANGMPRDIIQEETIETALALVRIANAKVLPFYFSLGDKDSKSLEVEDIEGKVDSERKNEARAKNIQGIVRRTSTLVECLANLFGTERGLTDSLVMQMAVSVFDGLKVPGLSVLHTSCAIAVRHLYQSYPSHRRAFLSDCNDLISSFPPSRRSLRAYRLRDGTGAMRISSVLPLVIAQSCNTASTHEHGGRENKLEAFKGEFKNVRDLFLSLIDNLIKRCFGDRDPEYKQAVITFIEDMILAAKSAEWPAAVDIMKLCIIVIVRRLREILAADQVKGQVLGLSILLDLLGSLLTACREILSLAASVDENLESALKLVSSYATGPDGDQFQIDCRGYWISLLSLRSPDLMDIECDTNEFFDPSQASPRRHSAKLHSADGSLSSLCDSGVEVISHLLQSPYPTIRARCVKSLSGVATISPTYLRQNETLNGAIEQGCVDVSTLVREASLDLLSKTFTNRGTELAVDVSFWSHVYPFVERRLFDTATSVRKRSVLILQNLIMSVAESPREESRDLLCEAAAKIATRLDDHEKTVRDIAVKTLRYILLGLVTESESQTSICLLCKRLVGTASRMNPQRSTEYLSQLVTSENKIDMDQIRPQIIRIFPALIGEAQDLQSRGDQKETSTSERYPSSLHLRLGAMSVIESFVNVVPLAAADHCDYLALELQCGYTKAEKSDLLTLRSVLAIIEKVLPALPNPSSSLVESVERDIEEIIRRHQDSRIGQSAVKALCRVSACVTKSRRVPLALADQFLHFIVSKTKNPTSIGSAPRSTTMALARAGLFCRYGNFDRDHVARTYNTLVEFYKTCDASTEEGVLLLRDPCLRGISHVFVAHRDYLAPSSQILKSCLQSELPRDEPLLLRVLYDLQDILQEEESRNSTRKGLEKTELSAEEDSDAGFLAGTAQCLFADIERIASHSSPRIRALVSQLVGMLVRQGLVLPAVVVPCMVTLSVDPASPRTRLSAQRVLSLIADRHPQMLFSHLKLGVARSPSVARAVADSNPIDVALNGSGVSFLSQGVMLLSRKKRQLLLEGIVRLYDPKTWKATQKMPVFDQVYLASSIASLDFVAGVISVEGRAKAMREEVLPVVAAVNRISSSAGQVTLQDCKALKKDVSSETLIDLERRAVAISILLCLKHHLKFVRFRGKHSATDGLDLDEGNVETSDIPKLSLSSVDFTSEFGDKTKGRNRLDQFRVRMKEDVIEESEIAFLTPTKKRKRAGKAVRTLDDDSDEEADLSNSLDVRPKMGL